MEEFIKMQRQDLETSENVILKELLTAVEEVLKQYPSTIELDSRLTIQSLYNAMEKEARSKAEDIVQEGIDNHNCVGTYLGRVSKGNSIICFVRHSDNISKSFYTLELNPKTLNIVQCRGYSNGTTSEETQVQKFVNKWRKEVVLKRLTKQNI